MAVSPELIELVESLSQVDRAIMLEAADKHAPDVAAFIREVIRRRAEEN